MRVHVHRARREGDIILSHNSGSEGAGGWLGGGVDAGD
jgi:hypothetical protein